MKEESLDSLCQVCEKKRARRSCPGLHGEICPVCCGTGRENTIDCPLDCEYLQEARRHEPQNQLDPEHLPNPDIKVSEAFLSEHEALIGWLTNAIATGMETAHAVDNDAREALDALIRTYRTLQSGLYYETRPQNPFAAQVQQEVQRSVEEYRKRKAEESGMQTLRDTEVLGVLVFLDRVEKQFNNGRPRGRAFLQFLRAHFPAAAAPSVLA